MMTDRFARHTPDDTPPDHGEPTLRPIDLRPDTILRALGETHKIFTAALLERRDTTQRLQELPINGRACKMTGDSLGGWYLFETMDHGRDPRRKEFYLLPCSVYDLRRHNGEVPYVEFTDPDFDNNHRSPKAQRRIRLYVLACLLDVIIDEDITRVSNG